MNTKRLTKLVALVLALVMSLATLAACGPTESTTTTTTTTTKPAPVWEDDGKMYTYNTYTSVSPSNWNELTYQDSNDTQIMSYIGSAFFNYDFKFDENGEIVPGEFEIKYGAATLLEDVTAEYKDAWNIHGDKAYAYRITLRDDLKWQNGDPIDANDFVYTMKEQLDPAFMHYRADSYYAGSTNLVNAQLYTKQGQHRDLLDNGAEPIYVMADLVKGDDGVYTQPNGDPIYFAFAEGISWCGGYSVEFYHTYYASKGVELFNNEAFAALSALCDDNGLVAVTDETIALWTTLIDMPMWGNEDETNLPNYLVCPDFDFEIMDFSQVGIFAESKYELVIVLKNALDLLKDDGSLSYKCAYNLSSLPLVHKETYEASKKAPQEGSELWTTNYCSNVETTMSWGPYKLTSFQAGKQYILDRNLNWFGYNGSENAGLYDTDRIVCDTVEEWQSAWTMFQAGDIDGIGIDVSIAADYKNSDRAYYTADDYVGSLQLQSDVAALETRTAKDGKSHMLLKYADFRKALSLSINRADYVNQCTTASLAGFGLFNSMHYYDVENGGVFRNTDEAKKVLCNVYGVNVDDYASLDDAVNAITGYNVDLARELVASAYAQAVADGLADSSTLFLITFGSGADNESVRRHYNYLTNAWTEMFKGTDLEGRVSFDFEDHGTAWATDFQAGAYDITMGGWSGAAWDPGYFLLAYLSPDYMFSQGWDTSSHMMTFTMKGVAEDGGDITDTMSLMQWYNCLNGLSGAKYDFSSNALEESQRLQLIAALEEQVLLAYYSVPTYNAFSASLISYKVDYITYEYNTFMSYGGIKYMVYNYTDAEWEAAVAEMGGIVEYK